MLSQKNASGEIDHCSVNACLRPLLSMAGQMVTTTEGIGNDVDGFHPVQSRIAECNGTQCAPAFLLCLPDPSRADEVRAAAGAASARRGT